MKKVYLAGPDCFRFDASIFYENICDTLRLYGFEPIVPSDGELSKGAPQDQVTAKKIYDENIEKLKSCDVVLANLNVFRGAEADSGTCFEVGFATALGKPVFGYMQTNEE